MPLPSNFNTRAVHGKYVELDGDPAQGKVIFSSSVILANPGENVFVVPVPIEATLDSNGEFTINLPCTNDTDLNPTSWQYTVTEQFVGSAGRTFNLEVPIGAGTIELADLAELPSQPPVYTNNFVRSFNGLMGDVAINIYNLPSWDFVSGSYRVPESIAADGVTNVTAALQSWIAGLPNGARVVFKAGGSYRLNSPGIEIGKPLWFDGNGAKFISTSGTGVAAFPAIKINSSHVRISNCELVGPGPLPYAANHAGSGIYLLSSSWAARHANVTIHDNIIHDFGMAGIWIEWAENVHVRNNRFYENSYSNCTMLSVQNGSYIGNHGLDPAKFLHAVRTVSDNDVTYGLQVSRWTPYDISLAPRSKNIEVAFNYQENYYWECLDTHAGENVRFHHNSTKGWIGVACVSAPNQSGIDSYAPLDCIIESNQHDSGFDDGRCSYAYTFAGAESGTPGTIVQLATGQIRNNVVRRAGNSELKHDALYIHDTKGLRVSENQFYECATGGFQFYHDNYLASCRKNYFEEMWSNASTTPFTGDVRVRSSHNTLSVEGNQHYDSNTKSSAAVSNQRGLYVANTTGVTVYKGWNDFAACSTPYSPSTSVAYVNMYSQGFPMTEVLAYDPYSTIEPYYTNIPEWTKEQDAKRIAAYSLYEQMYWNVPDTFKVQLRGSNATPIYIPEAKTIVEATNRYLAKDLSFIADPDIGSPQDQIDIVTAFTNLFNREAFWSKFNSNKRYGLIRGDWCFHIIGYGSRPFGRRIRIDCLDPASYFPVSHPTDPDRIIAAHIVEQIQDPEDENKFLIKRQTYQKGADPENNDGSDTTIYNSIALFDPEAWERLDLQDAVEILKPLEPLPPAITSIPIYHIKNFQTPGDPFGSSELRGLERCLLAVNQAISDEELALALEGLGVYATDSGKPKDDNGNPTNWRMGPGVVVEHGQDKKFYRVNGIGSVTPYMDHLGFLIRSIREASATPDAAIGKVDVSVAESGISLALQMSPMLSKVKEEDQAIIDVIRQMFFDLRNWFAAYEGMQLAGYAIPILGEKLPKDKDKEVQRIIEMVEKGIATAEWARVELNKYGYEFPTDEGNKLVQESQARALATDPFAARMAAELETTTE